MKTIEEAAKAYSKAQHGSDPAWQPDRYQSNCDFMAGVEFAQRWIPVEEELPEEGDEIICKDDFYIAVHVYYTDGLIDENYLKSNYTHWRPIEYK